MTNCISGLQRKSQRVYVDVGQSTRFYNLLVPDVDRKHRQHRAISKSREKRVPNPEVLQHQLLTQCQKLIAGKPARNVERLSFHSSAQMLLAKRENILDSIGFDILIAHVRISNA